MSRLLKNATGYSSARARDDNGCVLYSECFSILANVHCPVIGARPFFFFFLGGGAIYRMLLTSESFAVSQEKREDHCTERARHQRRAGAPMYYGRVSAVARAATRMDSRFASHVNASMSMTRVVFS
jgi:hypothetical protein